MIQSKKNTSLFLLIILISIVQTLHAQNNYKAYYKTLYKAKKYKEKDSIIKYNLKTFTYGEPLAMDIKTLAYRYYTNKDYKNAYKYLKKAVKNGLQLENDYCLDTITCINYNKYFFKIKKNNTPYDNFVLRYFNKKKKKLRTLRAKYLKKIRSSTDNKYYEIFLQNEIFFQKTRLETLPKKVSDTIYKTLAKYLNSSNSYFMLELLKNNSFPDRKKCARFNNHTISILLNHAVASFANKEDAKLFIDLLWKEVEKGNIAPNEYAATYDHYINWYVDEEKAELGYKFEFDFENKKMRIIDLLRPNEVDKLRNKFWLPSIKSFTNNTGILAPKNYK